MEVEVVEDSDMNLHVTSQASFLTFLFHDLGII